MPLVKMPDGTVVSMPDKLSPDVAAKLRSIQATGADPFERAKKMYPILAKADISYAYQPKGVKPTGMLEFYGPQETDRPASMPLGKPGIAVFDPKTRPMDILADYVSHYGRDTDPVLKDNYNKFAASMTPDQQQHLQEQYKYAQLNEGEARPFDEWSKTSGVPAWYRGYLFDQWPKDFVSKNYTPDQLKQLDSVKGYLGMGKQ